MVFAVSLRVAPSPSERVRISHFAPAENPRPRVAENTHDARTAKTRLNGASAARRKRVKPVAIATAHILLRGERA